MTPQDDENHEQEWFCKQVLEHVWGLGITNPVILQVGALDGYEARYIAARMPVGRVVCVDGDPRVFRDYLAGRTDCEPFENVIARRTGEVSFHLRALGLSSLTRQDGPEAHDTTALSLDDFCSSIELQPDVVIIDAEGSSYEICEGGTDVLAAASLLVLETNYVEIGKGERLHGDLVRLLSGRGYNQVEGAGYGASGQWNVLFKKGITVGAA